MVVTFERIAVVGATGPTGRALVDMLDDRGHAVRAISRSQERLHRCFPASGIEKRAGDALSFPALAAALQGCDLIIDCIGLPAARMDEHVVTARNIARCMRESGARCAQVSSYWSFLPVRRLPVAEDHPRQDGPPWARCRREAEDVLRDAGAAIVHLPDFFGPHVHTGTLQLALVDAVRGKPMNWIGPADIERDYVFVPDAMNVVAALVSQRKAYAADWVVPGSGAVSARRIAEILGGVLGRTVHVRAAAPWLLRLLSLFRSDLRGFLQLVPDYARPIRYDGSRLRQLVGDLPRTPYEIALRATVDWIRSGTSA